MQKIWEAICIINLQNKIYLDSKMFTNIYSSHKNPFYNKNRSDACYQSVQASIREKIFSSTFTQKIKIEPIHANRSIFMYYVLSKSNHRI